MKSEREERGEMTVEEAGRKGGEKTRETHDKSFYSEIGQMGGERTRETHGHDFYEAIGHKGGQKTKRLVEEGRASEGGGSKGPRQREEM